MDEKKTVYYKSKKFSIRIVNLRKYLIAIKTNIYYQLRYYAREQVLVPIWLKVQVQCQKMIFWQKYILHLKSVLKLYIG